LPAWQALAAPADIRSRPQAAKRWRGTPGLLGPSRQGWLFRSQPQPALSAEAPFDVAARAHQAGNVLPEAIVEHGLPRHSELKLGALRRAASGLTLLHQANVGPPSLRRIWLIDDLDAAIAPSMVQNDLAEDL